MKTVRISVLTMVLLVGAAPGSVPINDNQPTNETHTPAQTLGPCFFVNGVWMCADN